MEDWLKPRGQAGAAQAGLVRAHRMKQAYKVWAKDDGTDSEYLLCGNRGHVGVDLATPSRRTDFRVEVTG